MRLTIRHYFDFGADARRVGGSLIANPAAWDAVRATAGAFNMPRSREELEVEIRGRPLLMQRAQAISSVRRRRFGPRVVSYGVGTGALEACLLRFDSDIELTLTEFAPLSLEALRPLFPSQHVVKHNLRLDAPLPGDLHLLHRIDTEFTDDQWRLILKRFPGPVLMVASEVLGLVGGLRELRTRLRRSATHAGYLRTRASFVGLFPGLVEEIPIGDLRGFLSP